MISAELFAHLLLTSKQPGTMASEHTVTDKVASGRGSALTGDRSTVRLSVALKVICPKAMWQRYVTAWHPRGAKR